MIVRCVICGDPIDLERNVYYQKVSGYERPRTGGGTNAIFLRTTFEKFMCEPCMLKARAGVLGQLEIGEEA